MKLKKANLLYNNAKSEYTAKFKTGFIYEFSDEDYERIQSLINELHDLIVSSTLFEENHKERILKKLEKLQQELHKRMSSLDKFWGVIGDAGVVLGKFGEDAKPFIDIFREIALIIWKTQAIAEELPPNTPFPQLNSPKKEQS